VLLCLVDEAITNRSSSLARTRPGRPATSHKSFRSLFGIVRFPRSANDEKLQSQSMDGFQDSRAFSCESLLCTASSSQAWPRQREGMLEMTQSRRVTPNLLSILQGTQHSTAQHSTARSSVAQPPKHQDNLNHSAQTTATLRIPGYQRLDQANNHIRETKSSHIADALCFGGRTCPATTRKTELPQTPSQPAAVQYE